MGGGLKLFLSYRRGDLHGLASGLVGRIYDRLAEHYGSANVFMDVDTIPPGVRFDLYLGEAVAQADVLLAVVGSQWLEILQQREGAEVDFVRIEIETALQRSIPVVPLLVGGAQMPEERDLPASLAGFVKHNAYRLDTERDFNAHLTRLIRELDEHFGEGKGSRASFWESLRGLAGRGWGWCRAQSWPRRLPSWGRAFWGRLTEWARGVSPLVWGIVCMLAGAALLLVLQPPQMRPGAEDAPESGLADLSSWEEETPTGLAMVPEVEEPLGGQISGEAVVANLEGKEGSGVAPSQERAAKVGEPFTNELGVEMVWCPPGNFLMGSPDSEEGRGSDETYHRVMLTEGFWMAGHEITEEQWARLLEDDGESREQGVSSFPQVDVGWEEAVVFCETLTARERETGGLPEGYEYRLPSEAQWEYACRAGTSGPYNLPGVDPDELAYSQENSGLKIHPVGQKRPNAWGIHDMHGNALEWCADWYGLYPEEDRTDPAGPEHGEVRVLRGGCYLFKVEDCRSAYRFWDVLLGRLRESGHSRALPAGVVGFRPVLTAVLPREMTEDE